MSQSGTGTGTDQICTDSRSDHFRTETYFSFIHPVPFLDIFLICYNSMISFVQQNLWSNNHLKIRSDIKTAAAAADWLEKINNDNVHRPINISDHWTNQCHYCHALTDNWCKIFSILLRIYFSAQILERAKWQRCDQN